MKLKATLAPEPEPVGKSEPAVAPVVKVVAATRGASTRRVGLPVALLCAASKRSMIPGAEADDAVVRNPP